MARIVRLEFNGVNEDDYAYYKPEGERTTGASVLINKTFRNRCLKRLRPEGTRAVLIVFEEGEEY